MKYVPIKNNTTLEIVQNNQMSSFSSFDNKAYRDPKNQFSPRVYKVIRSEKVLKLSLSFIWLGIMLFTLILFILTYTSAIPNWLKKENTGYLVLFGIAGLIAFFFAIKNLIENSTWNHTIERYRDAVQSGNQTTSNTFHLTYRKIVLKGVNLIWILVFVITYYGLFTLIVYGLYVSGAWTFGKDPETGKITKIIAFDLDWPAILTKAFRKVEVFTIINFAILGSIVVAFITMKLVDKKRLANLDDFLGEKSIEVHGQIDQAKKDRNKMWLRIYIVVVVLTILLPLALLIIAIWRGLLKKKKSAV